MKTFTQGFLPVHSARSWGEKDTFSHNAHRKKCNQLNVHLRRALARTHACLHTHTHTYKHTHKRTHTHTHARTHARTHAHANTHIPHINTHTHTCTHTHTHILTHRNTDTHTHARTHARTHVDLLYLTYTSKQVPFVTIRGTCLMYKMPTRKVTYRRLGAVGGSRNFIDKITQ